MRKSFFPWRVAEHWKSPSLETFQTHLDVFLCHLRQVTLPCKGVWLGDLQRSLSALTILWTCESCIYCTWGHSFALILILLWVLPEGPHHCNASCPSTPHSFLCLGLRATSPHLMSPPHLVALCAWASGLHHRTSCPSTLHGFVCWSLRAAPPRLMFLCTSQLHVLEPRSRITAPRVPPPLTALCAHASEPHHHTLCPSAPHSFPPLGLRAASLHLVSLHSSGHHHSALPVPLSP